MFFLIALTVCLCATWPISCASTPASSASFLISPSAPRVMCTIPPGEANALTPSVSRTMKVQGSEGRSDWRASTVPTSVTYLWTGALCTTPKRWRILALTSSPIFRSSSSVTFRSSNLSLASFAC